MKNKIIIGAMIVVAISLLYEMAHAQSTPINIQVADGQVQKAKKEIDNVNALVAGNTANSQALLASIAPDQQGLMSSAAQTPPLQSAVDLCNSNPALYCPGWVVTTPPVAGVNWDAIAGLMATGVNWPTALNTLGLNWSTISQASGVNWASLNLSSAGINWSDWPIVEAQGINWAQWLENGGK